MNKKRTKYYHLGTFDCTAYVLVDLEKRDKLGVKIVKCYFIDYDSNKFEYRFLDDKNKKF